MVTTLNPTSTTLPPSSDDSGLPTTVYIAVGAGGGAVVVITCIGVFIVLTICIRSRSITKRKEGNKTSPFTEGLWVRVFTVYCSCKVSPCFVEESKKQTDLPLKELK